MRQETNHRATVSSAELMQAAETAARSGKRQIVRVEGKDLSIAPLGRHAAGAPGQIERPTGKPGARRKTGILTPDDPLFRLVGIGDSGVAGGISGRKHEYLGKLRHS